MATDRKERAKRNARIAELRQQCQVLSNERSDLEDINEHEDYTQPLKVRWLCARCHAVIREKARII